MSQLSVGIVGLPNVGIVPVSDERLMKLAELASKLGIGARTVKRYIDIDLSFPEAEYPRTIKILEEKTPGM